jgi:asparaginyl-tRNA synthetase
MVVDMYLSNCLAAPLAVQDVLDKPFATVTYTEAVNLLKKSGKKFDYPVEWGLDLQSEHER